MKRVFNEGKPILVQEKNWESQLQGKLNQQAKQKLNQKKKTPENRANIQEKQT